jgi:hypothetical protein
VISFMLLSLYTRGMSPRHPLDRRLGGPQSLSKQHRDMKILDPTGTQKNPTSQSSIPYPFAIQPALQRLVILKYCTFYIFVAVNDILKFYRTIKIYVPVVRLLSIYRISGVLMKSSIFWNTMPCRPLEVNGRLSTRHCIPEDRTLGVCSKGKDRRTLLSGFMKSTYLCLETHKCLQSFRYVDVVYAIALMNELEHQFLKHYSGYSKIYRGY